MLKQNFLLQYLFSVVFVTLLYYFFDCSLHLLYFLYSKEYTENLWQKYG